MIFHEPKNKPEPQDLIKFGEKIIEYKKNNQDKEEKIKLSLMMAEYVALRRYIDTYIKCRTTYFWSSLAVTGTVLAFVVQLLSNKLLVNLGNLVNIEDKMLLENGLINIIKNIYYNNITLAILAPLLIVTPFWCIYFDKTSTIVRISSYVRVLEWMIINFEDKNKYYCGFDTYIKFYRDDIKKAYIDKNIFSRMAKLVKRAILVKDSGFSKVINFKMPNQEIYLSWSVFFLLSIPCLFLVILSTSNILIAITAILIFLSSFIYTLYVVRELVDTNSRSQSNKEQQCRDILEKIMLLDKNEITKPLFELDKPPVLSKKWLVTWIIFLFLLLWFFIYKFPIVKY